MRRTPPLDVVPVEIGVSHRDDIADVVAVFRAIQFPMLIPTLTANSVLALITGIALTVQGFGMLVLAWSVRSAD